LQFYVADHTQIGKNILEEVDPSQNFFLPPYRTIADSLNYRYLV